jgi:hypothetical protein
MCEKEGSIPFQGLVAAQEGQVTQQEEKQEK